MTEILHVFFSDNKFLDPTIDQFESVYPGKNRYLVILNNGAFKFDKGYYKHLDKCEMIPNDQKKVRKEIENARLVIIHRLSLFLKKVISGVRSDTVITWFCWGGDIYSENCFFDNRFTLEEKTLAIAESLGKKNDRSIWRKISGITSPQLAFRVNSLINFFTDKLLSKPLTSNYVYQAIDRIDFLACVIPDEFDLIRSKTNLTARQAYYSYTNLKLLCGSYYGTEVALGNKILCGNAATFSNNHADILDHVAEKNVKNELIVPLSYGDSDQYADRVIEIGKAKFGEQFQPLTEFMSRDKYSEILCSCGFMVMNNRRQEAVGNIILGLYLGMKVFLHEDSVVLKFLRSREFIVYSFQKDFDPEQLAPLSGNEKEVNREKLEAYWGVKATEQRLSQTIGMLNEEV